MLREVKDGLRLDEVGPVVWAVVVVVVVVTRVSKNKGEGEGELKFADGKGLSSSFVLSSARSVLVCSSSACNLVSSSILALSLFCRFPALEFAGSFFAIVVFWAGFFTFLNSNKSMWWCFSTFFKFCLWAQINT